MEENIISPVEINSVHINKVLRTSIAYLNKKRKFQAEQLGMPLPKNKCTGRIFSLQCNSSSNSNPEAEELGICVSQQHSNEGARYDESELESMKESNSLAGDADSVMSTSDSLEANPGYLKGFSSDQPSISSSSWGGNSSKSTLYSLESRSISQSSYEKLERPFIGGDVACYDHNYVPNSSLNYEEHLLEFGSHVECSCLECKAESFEQHTDRELADMLYSNGLTPDNYVLSSGRWSINQDAQEGSKKLTIDKEFEQYFSMLML